MSERPSNMSRRWFLGGAATSLAALVSSKGAEAKATPIDHYKKAYELALQSFQKDKKFQDNAFNTENADGTNNFERVNEIVSKFKFVNIPEDVLAKYINAIVAIPAAESRFDSRHYKSSAGALGPWQIKPVVLEDIRQNNLLNKKDLTEANLLKLEEATVMGLAFLDRLVYKNVGWRAESIATLFNVDNEQEAQYFAFLVSVNAYNTGYSRMIKLTDAFYEAHKNRNVDVRKKEDLKTGMELFKLFSNYCRDNMPRQYTDESVGYVAKVLAAENVLTSKG